MASAIISALDYKLWHITVAEVSEPARIALSTRFPHVRILSSLDSKQDLQASKILFFAVKPQSLPTVLDSIASTDLSGKIVISIMAGITIQRLQQNLKGTGIQYIRCMPNTPFMVGKGVTGVYPDSENTRKLCHDLLGSCCDLFYFNTEDSLDKVTALSGSGPAYFFAFIEGLRKAGEGMGFSPEMASKMAVRTALGAAELASTSNFDVSDLRKQVTSKGGTTEAALKVFTERGLDETVDKAVQAALTRSLELAKL